MRVQKQIERLRKGEKFDGDIVPFLVPDAHGVDLLAAELRSDAPVREREAIVRILVAIGQRTDSAGQLRDRQILSILLRDAALVHDAAYMLALDQILKSAPKASLKEFGNSLAALVPTRSEPDLFLVIAKAKATEALPALRKLEHVPRWAKDGAFMVALAALGDRPMEEKFEKSFLETNDPKRKMDLAKSLGYIGTPNALKSLAGEMRSPLVQELPGTFETSVRLEIAKALHFNHPDKAFLVSIQTEADYERIEKFCETEYGVVWHSARPPFLTYNNLPPQ